MRKLYLFLLFISSSIYVNSQELKIRSVSFQPFDNSATLYPCFDNNGDTCALIKIKTDNLDGIIFSNPNQYVKTIYSSGLYSVYLPAISRKLDIQHKDYMPIQLDLAEYGYRKLRKGKTYFVVLDAPKKTDLKSSVIFKIDPQNSVVTFGKERLEPSDDGTYEIPVTAGTYPYTVRAENYQSKEGIISVAKYEVKTIPIRLLPITHELIVGCNVDKARVFVDNIDYGQVGKIILPQGNHNIRVQAEGYVDSERLVSVNASTGPLSFVLKENKRTTHVHATPVRIFANSSKVYKNQKEIKDWNNSGDIVLIMPGRYEISDYEGNVERIVVGTDSVVVRLGSTGPFTTDYSEDVTTNMRSENRIGDLNQYDRRSLQHQNYIDSRISRTNANNISSPIQRAAPRGRSGYQQSVRGQQQQRPNGSKTDRISNNKPSSIQRTTPQIRSIYKQGVRGQQQQRHFGSKTR